MIEFKLFKQHTNITAGATTRKWGGNFKEDQPLFETSLKKLQTELNTSRPVTSYQVHKDQIVVVDSPTERTPTGDALITNQLNRPLMVKVADCQGVVMHDPITKSIGCVHSGWRGSSQNIIGKTIQRMQSEYGTKPSDLVVSISPSLGPCCAEFTDPNSELPAFMKPYIIGRHVNFWALSKNQLMEAGVSEDKIELPTQCTKCSGQFYSHRNGDKERMGVFILLNKT